MIRIIKPLDERLYDVDLGAGVSSTEKILKYYEQDPKNTFISFTQLDKLGANPKTGYQTPVGIYSYPVSEYATEMKKHPKKKAGDFVPYAGNSPYVNVFRARNPEKVIWDIGDPATYERLYFDAQKIFEKWIVPSFDVDPPYAVYSIVFDITCEMTDTTDDPEMEVTHEIAEDIFHLFLRHLGIEDHIDSSPQTLDISVYPAGGIYAHEYKVIVSRQAGLPLGMVPSISELDLSLINQNSDRSRFYYEYIYPMEKAEEYLKPRIKDDNCVIKFTTDIELDVSRRAVAFRSVDEMLEDAEQNARSETEGGELWYLMMKVSGMVAEKQGRSAPAVWRSIIKSLGYEGVVDVSGEGVIHPAEATQAYFVDSSVVDVVERMENVEAASDAPIWMISEVNEPDWVENVESVANYSRVRDIVSSKLRFLTVSLRDILSKTALVSFKTEMESNDLFQKLDTTFEEVVSSPISVLYEKYQSSRIRDLFFPYIVRQHHHKGDVLIPILFRNVIRNARKAMDWKELAKQLKQVLA